jgi:hypothetical protein
MTPSTDIHSSHAPYDALDKAHPRGGISVLDVGCLHAGQRADDQGGQKRSGRRWGTDQTVVVAEEVLAAGLGPCRGAAADHVTHPFG